MGVIYRNEFIDNWFVNLGYGVAIDGSVAGWNRPLALGTANAVFVEDNLFVRNRHCVTSTNGANYVARFNTVRDNYQDAQSFDAHGLSPAWPRGTRSVEIYGNVVTNTVIRWAGAGIRGGSGVIWDNVWNGVSHGVVVSLEDPPPGQPLAAYPALDQIGNPYDLYVWNNISTGDAVYANPTSNSRGIDYWLKAGSRTLLHHAEARLPPLRLPASAEGNQLVEVHAIKNPAAETAGLWHSWMRAD